MPISIARASFRPLLLAAGASLLSCSSGGMSAPELGTQQSALVRIELSKTRFVEVYEFQPGQVAFYDPCTLAKV